MMTSALLLPAHGHAPYLIGVRMLRKLVRSVCIPEYYGNQRDVLHHEFPNDSGRIFLSEAMGTLLQPLLLDGKDEPGIDLFAAKVREHGKRISSELERMLNEGIEAVALDGTRQRFASFDFMLNTGLPVKAPAKKDVFYTFVSKMSEIYRLSPYQSAGVQFLTEVWQEIESSFDAMFVPRLHSLYGCEEFDADGITFTPPFAEAYPFNNDDAANVPNGSILVIASGTGMAVPKLVDLMAASPRSYVTLEKSPPEFDQYARKDRVSSKAWGNPNVIAVLARSGLGSVWQAFLNQKPIGVVTPNAQVDPEVFHNAQMVEKAGIGKILNGRIDHLIEVLPQCCSEIQKQLQLEHENFGTIDGIEYTSAALKTFVKE